MAEPRPGMAPPAMQTLLVASLLFHALVVDPIAWAGFRLIAGASVAGSYMVLESWLNERVTNETRGAVMSAYLVWMMFKGDGAPQRRLEGSFEAV